MALYATVTLEVEIHKELEPGVSNPIQGTELPHEYLAIRQVTATGVTISGNVNAVALLDHDDSPLDVDDLMEEAVRQTLSDQLPIDGHGYRQFLPPST